jgi:alcohol dehydrogenase (cytochrome c)
MRAWRFPAVAIVLVAGILAFPGGGINANARATAASVDWPSFNDDLGSTRYASPKLISTSNAGALHVLCSASFGNVADFQSGPLAIGGIIYATSLAATYAVNGSNCKKIWTRTYALPAGSGGTNRGAAYANGLLYRGFSNGHVVALSAATGATVWDVDLLPAGSYAYFNAAPIVSGGRVFIGTAGGDIGEAGHIMALSASTGALLWSVQTVPNLGSPAAASWTGATHIAGGSTWTSYTLDTTANRLYVSAGNPGADFYGADRAGVNLGSDSVVVFDATTGAVKAEYQLVPHDVHDWDVGATPAFVRPGNADPLAVVAAKDGYVRAVDTVTGRTNWSTAVTTIANASAPVVPSGTHFCPGTKGGVVWNGPALSTHTAWAYVGSVDWCSTLELATAPPTYKPGKSWLGSSDSYGTSDPMSSGHVTALDVALGYVAWTCKTPAPVVAGVTATAGGLVLTGDLAGNFYAFNDRSGAVLKTLALGAPIGGGVITYVTGGKQYIAVAAGLTSASWGTSKSTAPAQIDIIGL